MFNIRRIIFKILDLFSKFKDLNIVSLKRTIFLISITIFVMLFDALSILSIMPLIQFIQAGQNIDHFIEVTNYGNYLFNFYNYLSVPFTLFNLSFILLLFILTRQLINIFEILETERTKLQITKDLSIKCFRSIMSSKAKYIRSIKQGQFTALCETECMKTGLLYKSFLQLTGALLQITAYAAVMFYVAPYMTAMAVIIIILLIFSMITFVRKSYITGDIVVDLRRRFYNFVSENFSLWRLFKFGSLVDNEIRQIEKLADNYADKQLAIVRYSNISRFIMAILAMFFCIVFLNLSVNYFDLDLVKITLFALIFIRMVPLGTKVNGLINSIFSLVPSLHVIRKILYDSEKNKEELAKGILFGNNKTSIEFKNVDFTYNNIKNNSVLKNINLVIPENKITAIVGRSGSGKSTLIDLLPQIILPISGEIFIGDKNIKDYSLASLRNEISFVSQDTILFDGTIKENIGYYAPNSTNADIIKASILSGAAEFIDKLPNKYEYNIGEKGQKLSGGQKQRLVLARAFLSKAKILILDEATSSLDHKSELHIKKSINEFIKVNNSTIIIIAHRHTTIESADFVVYLEKGKILDTGNPKYIFNKYYQ